MNVWRIGLLAGTGLLLAACGTTPKKSAAPNPGNTPASGHSGSNPVPAASSGTARVSPYAPAQEDPAKRGNYVAGGLYAPGVRDTVPDYIPNVEAIPEPEVVHLPRSAYGNRSPYTVLGKRYTVMDDHRGYVERGRASYYGNKFHGRRTSNQEVYDMYAFTAAHRNLPLPSFARVTNIDNGKSVVVRVNDRGPFHSDRLIDLSYAAAVKLGFREAGTANVEVRALLPEDMASTPAPTMAAPLVASVQHRFDMLQNGQVMTADQFDQWMESRQVRVAGRPAGSKAAEPPPSAAVATSVAASAGVVELQVASFASPDNAQRALGMLNDAGVSGARLLDSVVNGRRVWRLRVGPLDEASASALASRIVGLGFGQPTRVRQ